MNGAALQTVIDYAEDQAIEVQITCTKDGWTVDLVNEIHARVLFGELKDAGHDVTMRDDLVLYRIV